MLCSLPVPWSLEWLVGPALLNDPSLHSSLTGVLIECCLVRLRTESRVLGPQRLAGLRYFASALSPYCGGDRLFVFVMLMFVFHEGNFRL